MPKPMPGGRTRLDLVTIFFFVVLAVWVLTPFAATAGIAEDAVPYQAAGRLHSEYPQDIYASKSGGVHDLEDRFEHAYCDIARLDESDCSRLAVAFVATPLAIPFAALMSHLSVDAASLLMRLGAALMLAGGMLIIFMRLERRTRNARPILLATAVLLTPMAIVPIGFGQTSPLLFLSVCLGISSTRSRRTVASALVWTGAVAFKAFPAALIALVLYRKKWRFLGVGLVALAGLSLATLMLVPANVIGDFLHNSLLLSDSGANAVHNGSMVALIGGVIGESGSAHTAAVLVALAAGLAVCWYGFRDASPDTQWAVAYLALLVLSPTVWWHYLWVAIAALAIVLSEQRRLNDGLMVLLPVCAAATLPPSWPARAANGDLPIYQALFLISVTLVVLWLTRRSRGVIPSNRMCRAKRE